MNVHFPRSIRKIMQVSVTKELPNNPHTNFKAFRPAEIKQDKKKIGSQAHMIDFE